MQGFLLTWNPVIGEEGDNWSDDDLVRGLVKPFRKKGFVQTHWRTGAPKKMQPGDRVFLLKQGSRPKGIFGVGHILRRAVREPSDMRHRVYVRITHLVNPVERKFFVDEGEFIDILGRSLLGARFSGRSIPEDRLSILDKKLRQAGVK